MRKMDGWIDTALQSQNPLRHFGTILVFCIIMVVMTRRTDRTGFHEAVVHNFREKKIRQFMWQNPLCVWK